jgi:hypothetical protein
MNSMVRDTDQMLEVDMDVMKNTITQFYATWHAYPTASIPSKPYDALHVCLYELIALLSKNLCLFELKLNRYTHGTILDECRWWLETLSRIDLSLLKSHDMHIVLEETNLTVIQRLVTWIALDIERLVANVDLKKAKRKEEEEDEEVVEKEEKAIVK